MAMIPNNHLGRWVAVGLALVLGVVACATPTTTELEMGEQVQFVLGAEDATDEALEAFLGQAKEISQFVSARPEVDEVSVNVQREEGGDTEITLLVWGQELSGQRIVRDLQQRYPLLANAEVDTAPLKTEIRESIAQKIGREVFSLEIDGDDADAIRLQILTQLAEQGFEGDADVNVSREGDQTTIGITLEGEGLQTEDVIEIVGDGELPTLEIGAEAGEGDADVVIEERVQKEN